MSWRRVRRGRAFHNLWTTVWIATGAGEQEMQVSDGIRCGRRSPSTSGPAHRSRLVLDVQDVAPAPDRRSRAHHQRAEQPRPRPHPDPLPAARHRCPRRDDGRRRAQLVIVVDPAAPYHDLEQRSDGSGRDGPSADAPDDADRAAPATAPRAARARRGRAEPALHVRDVRQGRVQPVRPRRRPARRRDAGPLVQPAVHLRLGRPRQDPPAARHRPLRPPQLPAPRGALRLHRDVPQRVRRRHPVPTPTPPSSAATARSTCC